MRAYREAYRKKEGSGRLSQTGLLDLMGQVDERYLELHGHSTVARWESGTTRPKRERIEVFGRALDLSLAEIEGLIQLAGLEPVPASPAGRSQWLEDPVDAEIPVAESPADDEDRWDAGAVSWGETSSRAEESIKFALVWFLLPASYIAAGGLLLTWLGWNMPWLLMLYIGLAMGLVSAKGLLTGDPVNNFRNLYFACVFMLLSMPLLQAPFVRMDPYGLFTIGSLVNTPMPYSLALIVNLIMALAAGLLFGHLGRWRYSANRVGDNSAYLRASWITVPPMLVVLVCTFAFTSVGALPYLFGAFLALTCVFMVLVTSRDKDVPPLDLDMKLPVLGTVALIIVMMSAIIAVTVSAAYLVQGWVGLPDRSLLYSWNIDYQALGYHPGELGERLRLGALWASLGVLALVVIAGARRLATAVYPRGNGASTASTTAASVSLVVLLGVGGIVLSGNALVSVPTLLFNAAAEDIWLVPANISAGESAEIKARFQNHSSLSGPHGGEATFDISIVVESPSGSFFRHHVDNQPFSYSAEWTFTGEHSFDQAGTYTIRAEIFDVDGSQEEWNPHHRFDIRSETFTIGKTSGGPG